MSRASRITALATTLGQLMKLQLTSLGKLEADKTPFGLTDGATISINAAVSAIFTVTIAGNRTIAAPTNPTAGRPMMIRIRQDATGSRTLTWNAVFNFPGGTPPVLSTAANKFDYLAFVYNSVNTKWDFMGIQKGL